MNIKKLLGQWMVCALILSLSGCPACPEIGFVNATTKSIRFQFNGWDGVVLPNEGLTCPQSTTLSGSVHIGHKTYTFSPKVLEGLKSNELSELARSINEPSMPVCLFAENGKVVLGLKVIRTSTIRKPAKQPLGYPLKLNLIDE